MSVGTPFTINTASFLALSAGFSRSTYAVFNASDSTALRQIVIYFHKKSSFPDNRRNCFFCFIFPLLHATFSVFLSSREGLVQCLVFILCLRSDTTSITTWNWTSALVVWVFCTSFSTDLYPCACIPAFHSSEECRVKPLILS